MLHIWISDGEDRLVVKEILPYTYYNGCVEEFFVVCLIWRAKQVVLANVFMKGAGNDNKK